MEIFYETLTVGSIDTRGSELAFVYDPDWLGRPAAFPISLGMPLSTTPIRAERVLPWLANLLPESHLTEIGQQIGVSPQDILGLLGRMGRDTAGALAIGTPRSDGDAFRPVGSDTALARIINELPQRPFLVGEEGVSMSLAGAQDKLPVALIEGEIAIPIIGTPSTHILKPDTPRLKGSVQNEALCMTLAGLVGLDTARVTTGRAGRRSYLLVERYDRIIGPHRITRIHQEDFCQLLGYFPSSKYEFGYPRRPEPAPALRGHRDPCLARHPVGTSRRRDLERADRQRGRSRQELFDPDRSWRIGQTRSSLRSALRRGLASNHQAPPANHRRPDGGGASSRLRLARPGPSGRSGAGPYAPTCGRALRIGHHENR